MASYTRNDFADIKAEYSISSVIMRYVPLTRKGQEWVGCCPFHDDRTPSMYVNDSKGVFHCFGCDERGDVIDFIRAIESVSAGEAADIIGRGPKHRPVHREPHDHSDANVRAAGMIFNQSEDFEGTLAETYLARRGLPLTGFRHQLPIRFARLTHQSIPGEHPCLIAVINAPGGGITGIQRIYLTEEGEKLPGGSAKMSLGRVKGNAICLGSAAEHMIVTEGLEDGLSILFDNPGESVWVAAGASMLPSIELPPLCRRVTIAADNDTAGRAAAEKAASAFLLQGREVRIAFPDPAFKDFNEQRQAEAAR